MSYAPNPTPPPQKKENIFNLSKFVLKDPMVVGWDEDGSIAIYITGPLVSFPSQVSIMMQSSVTGQSGGPA